MSSKKKMKKIDQSVGDTSEIKKSKKSKKSKESEEQQNDEVVLDQESIDVPKVEKKDKKKEKKDKKKDKKDKKDKKKEKKEKKDKEKKSKKDKEARSKDESGDASNSAPTASKKRSREFDSEFPTGSYVMSEDLKNVSASEVDKFREENRITVEDPLIGNEKKSGDFWTPIMKFEHIGDNLPSSLMKVTNKFVKPSPIQAQAWPIALSGRDMVGIAATGSGKTLAFTLPSFLTILKQQPISRSNPGPYMLVLAPTRELAMQTAEVAEECGKANGKIKSLCVYGGVPKGIQADALRKNGGVHIVVATPGRLLDHLNDGNLDLSRVATLVLDEADRMLDMGFEKDIRAILAHVPKQRQTLMFSATWPQEIQKIASEFLSDPVRVTIGSEDLAASNSVTQIVEVMEPRAKDNALVRLLGKYHRNRSNRIIIFALYKKEADRLERFLRSKGYEVGGIHGDMSQEARTRAFNNFKSAKVPLLVATDVAARGLDIPNVEYVINYTFPLTIEDYVHRIGRTGRAGKTGVAHTFFTAHDKSHSGALYNVLKEANAEIPDELLKFGTHVKKKEHSLYGAHFRDSGAMPAAPTRLTFD